ncbi:hypothetical protein CAPTEDRAFT_211884 [Capitella teleta]|uniref:Uncharacterized protein n=1 Tax=Capitella teleta TaxID=283909 RepID=R7U6S3_CAPTE|nr:hypothetical protein CAPTEDRAFT_211884 [Capitella teleta]|eukprot:ELT99356.1 hypothetical protein CAPTEDRAFT_211884 [Capitella teleta]
MPSQYTNSVQSLHDTTKHEVHKETRVAADTVYHGEYKDRIPYIFYHRKGNKRVVYSIEISNQMLRESLMRGPQIKRLAPETDFDEVVLLLTKSQRLEAGRSPCNKAQQLSSFESEQEHGKRRCTAPVYLKDYDTDGSGSLPQELKVDMQVPSAHSAKKGKRFLEEDASFHRPAPVISEDED